MTTSKDQEKEPENGVETNRGSESEPPNLSGDWRNFWLLMVLYAMQGLPMGLIDAVPKILQSRKDVTYLDQTLLSFVTLPYSMKLLWAPLADTFYVRKFGRRKSWLVPIQLTIGGCFLIMANTDMLPDTEKPNIMKIGIAFFITAFLGGTQDIIVDSWALTMLKKKNIGYASTCNVTGFVAGKLIGLLSSTLLTSENFCNEYLRTTAGTGGVVTLKSLLYIFGILFTIVTILIAVYKNEKDCTLEDQHIKLNALQNYKLILNILKLPSIKVLALAMMTTKIGFATVNRVTDLKLIDAGVPIQNIMIINMAIKVMSTVISCTLSKYTSGPQPLSVDLQITPIRLFLNIGYVLLIYFTPDMIKINGIVDIPVYYFAILMTLSTLYEVFMKMSFMTTMTFYSRISDPRFGAVYISLLNTLSHLGSSLMSTLALGMVSVLSYNGCSSISNDDCSTLDLQDTNKKNENDCIIMDGYIVGTVLCTIIGFVWYFFFKNILKNLQSKSPSHWMVNLKQRFKENDHHSYPI